jgi:uncharacterized protein with PIN domain
MSAFNFEELKRHVGHKIVCVGYGQDEIVNVAVECLDCNEVLIDYSCPEWDDAVNRAERGNKDDGG